MRSDARVRRARRWRTTVSAAGWPCGGTSGRVVGGRHMGERTRVPGVLQQGPRVGMERTEQGQVEVARAERADGHTGRHVARDVWSVRRRAGHRTGGGQRGDARRAQRDAEGGHAQGTSGHAQRHHKRTGGAGAAGSSSAACARQRRASDGRRARGDASMRGRGTAGTGGRGLEAGGGSGSATDGSGTCVTARGDTDEAGVGGGGEGGGSAPGDTRRREGRCTVARSGMGGVEARAEGARQRGSRGQKERRRRQPR